MGTDGPLAACGQVLGSGVPVQDSAPQPAHFAVQYPSLCREYTAPWPIPSRHNPSHPNPSLTRISMRLPLLLLNSSSSDPLTPPGLPPLPSLELRRCLLPLALPLFPLLPLLPPGPPAARSPPERLPRSPVRPRSVPAPLRCFAAPEPAEAWLPGTLEVDSLSWVRQGPAGVKSQQDQLSMCASHAARQQHCSPSLLKGRVKGVMQELALRCA